MENTLILEQEEQVAIGTEEFKSTKIKKGKSLNAIRPLLIYLPFLGTCLALAFGQMYLWAIVLFVVGNLAFLWFYIVGQTSDIDFSIHMDSSIDQVHLEEELYDRSQRSN